MKNNKKSNKCINLFLLISTIIFQYIMPMEYNKECNNSQDLQQNNNEYSNDNKFSILMDLIPELQFYMMSKLVETEAYNKQYDVNNHIVIKGILCNLFSTCKYFKQFDNKKDINYIITNICKSLKDKGDSSYQANTNELKEILGKYYLRQKFLEIKKLILSGSDVNIQDEYGDTALMCAVKGKHKDIVGLLIAAGANINAINNEGSTALIWAAIKDHADIVELLIATGVNVNIQNEYGYTALMLACKFGYTDIIELLIKSGADVNIKNKDGDTALMLARKNGYTNIVALLIASGAIE